MKERKRSFARRIEAVDRINEAASGLMERIAEIESAEQQLSALEQRLAQWMQQLVQPYAVQPQELVAEGQAT